MSSESKEPSRLLRKPPAKPLSGSVDAAPEAAEGLGKPSPQGSLPLVAPRDRLRLRRCKFAARNARLPGVALSPRRSQPAWALFSDNRTLYSRASACGPPGPWESLSEVLNQGLMFLVLFLFFVFLSF